MTKSSFVKRPALRLGQGLQRSVVPRSRSAATVGLPR
jgi:hypothetical protein